MMSSGWDLMFLYMLQASMSNQMPAYGLYKHGAVVGRCIFPVRLFGNQLRNNRGEVNSVAGQIVS